MDTFNDQLPSGYYSMAMEDQEKTALPFYVFDGEVMLEHFMMDYAIPGTELDNWHQCCVRVDQWMYTHTYRHMCLYLCLRVRLMYIMCSM